MRRIFSKGRGKHNQIIPIVIILLSVFFLICLFSLSFSDKIGQAKHKLRISIFSGVFSDVIESGSGLIGYQVNKDNKIYPFPLNMASNFYDLHNFVSASTIIPQYSEVIRYETREDTRYYSDNTRYYSDNTQFDRETIRHDTEVDAMHYSENASHNSENTTQNIIGFNKMAKNKLSKEYILTNGSIFNGDGYEEYKEAGAFYDKNKELPVRIMDGAIDFNEFEWGYGGQGASIETMRSYNGTPFTLEQLRDVNFLVRNFYICAGGVVITDELFDSEVMLEKDMTIKTSNDKPQILIYHTHSQEAFIDSREGVMEDTVVGIGDLLTEVLQDKFGYEVIHDRSVYDVVNGKLDRNFAYNYARDGILKILEENPSIDVVIDLHRDGNNERTIYIDGKETAQIMLYNGLSRNAKGPITRLDNPNLHDNLAFTFQLQLKSLEMYPKLIYKNYLETLRYNLDVRPKSLLLEWGTNFNSLESARNAVEPFAEVLDAVLRGQKISR